MLQAVAAAVAVLRRGAHVVRAAHRCRVPPRLSAASPSASPSLLQVGQSVSAGQTPGCRHVAVCSGCRRCGSRAGGGAGNASASVINQLSGRFKHTSMGMRKQAKPTPLLWCRKRGQPVPWSWTGTAATATEKDEKNGNTLSAMGGKKEALLRARSGVVCENSLVSRFGAGQQDNSGILFFLPLSAGLLRVPKIL